MLQKLKTNPLAHLIWLAVTLGLHLIFFISKVDADLTVLERILRIIIAVGIIFPVHELIHFVFMKLFSKAETKIIVTKSPIGLTTLCTTSKGTFEKWQWLFIYLAPFVLLTLLLDILFIFSPKIELTFLLISLGNCAGCYYDLIDAISALRRN